MLVRQRCILSVCVARQYLDLCGRKQRGDEESSIQRSCMVCSVDRSVGSNRCWGIRWEEQVAVT